jgi:hypothetical protein
MRLARYVAYRERRGKCAGFWWESQKERDHLEEQGVEGRM